MTRTLWHLIFVWVAGSFGFAAIYSYLRTRRIEAVCYATTFALLVRAVTQ